MVSKRNLSSKKSDRLSISISPALKDWIQRYVTKKSNENPESEKYQSISSFVTHVMDSVLNLFEKGRELEDIQNVVDQKIESFYDKITFKAVLPFYEEVIKFYRYQEYDLQKLLKVLIMYKNFIVGEGILSPDDLAVKVDRFSNFFKDNKVSKDLNFEVEGDLYILEYFGEKYPNAHFEQSKAIAAIFGVLGLKLTDLLLSENYARYGFTKSELIYKKSPPMKEIERIVNDNLKKFTNYYQTVNDKPIYTWQKISQEEGVVMSFKSKKEGLIAVREIVKNIKENAAHPEEADGSIMRLLENFNWIEVKDWNELKFETLLTDNHIIQNHILAQILSENSLLEEKKYN